jgi:hypothetical protein
MRITKKTKDSFCRSDLNGDQYILYYILIYFKDYADEEAVVVQYEAERERRRKSTINLFISSLSSFNFDFFVILLLSN